MAVATKIALGLAEDGHPLGRGLLREEFSSGAYYQAMGFSYNPMLEYYAHVAELAEGELERVPPSLRPFFSDFLSPGPNRVIQGFGLVGAKQAASR